MYLTINAINCIQLYHDFNACSFEAGPMLTAWLSVFTKLLTKRSKHIITGYKIEI